MKTLKKALLGLFLCVSVAACSLLGGGANAPVGGQDGGVSVAQQDVANVVTDLDKGWNLLVPICLQAETSKLLAAGTCASVLLPVDDGIHAAAQFADAWDTAGQAALPCTLAKVIEGLSSTVKLLQDAKVQLPTAVTDALAAANMLGLVCPASTDAGAGG